MDGYTATSLVPSEDEMSKVTEVFARMRDSVIEASRLSGTVSALQEQVNALAENVSKLRKSNEFMDSHIVELRGQRDRFQQQYQEQVGLSAALRSERDKLEQHNGNQANELHRLNAEVASLKESLAKAQDEALDWMVKHDDASQKLEAISKMFQSPAADVPQPVIEQAKVEPPRTETGQFAPRVGYSDPEPSEDERPAWPRRDYY